MTTTYIPVSLEIEKETDKAYYVRIKSGECSNVERYTWIPKSQCKIQEYVQTYNALMEPETYGKRIIALARWIANKNKIF